MGRRNKYSTQVGKKEINGSGRDSWMRGMYKENLMGSDCREEGGWAIGSLGTREEGKTEAKDERR